MLLQNKIMIFPFDSNNNITTFIDGRGPLNDKWVWLQDLWAAVGSANGGQLFPRPP